MANRVLRGEYREVWVEPAQTTGNVQITTSIPVKRTAELSRAWARAVIDAQTGSPTISNPTFAISPSGFLVVNFSISAGGTIAYTLEVQWNHSIQQARDPSYAGLGQVFASGVAGGGGGGGGGSIDSGQIDDVFWDADPTPVFPFPGVGDLRAYYCKVLHEVSAPFSPDGINFYPYVAVYSRQTAAPCKLRFAFSTDGVAWVNGGLATGIAAAAHHAEILYIASTNRLLLWYWDEALGGGPASNVHRADCPANGIPAFVNDTPCANGITPWVTANPAWNGSTYGPCRFAYNPSPTNIPGDPTTFRYYGFMNTSNGTNEYLALVTSSDGIAWDLAKPTEVLSLVPGSWESLSISYCDFWKLPEGQWMMVYGGGTASPSGGIGLAFSDDFVNWTEHPANPVFQIGLNQWVNRCGAPNRLAVGTAAYMFYTGEPAVGGQPFVYRATRLTRWTREVLSWGGAPPDKQGRVLPAIRQGLGPPLIDGNIGDLYVNIQPGPPNTTLWVNESGGVGGWVPK